VAEFDFDAARRWAGFDPQRTLARRTVGVIAEIGKQIKR
jgi:hypothetical protein